MGLTDGAVLVRDIAADAAITFDDVRLPAGRLATDLWFEQAERFGQAIPAASGRGG